MKPKKIYVSMYAIEEQTRLVNETINLLTKDCSNTNSKEAIQKQCEILDNLEKLTEAYYQER